MARLARDVTEKKLQRELEEFGPIKRVRIVYDKKGALLAEWRVWESLGLRPGYATLWPGA